MDSTVSLYVMGLSVSQLKSGAYALILAEENGPRRIPLVIGEAEAKSIALVMEGIRTPRPVTHDLFVTFAHAFGIRMKKVFIYKFEDGIFYSQITFSDDADREVVIDARTSDAVAIAIRTETPIMTLESIVQRAGFIISDEVMKSDSQDNEAAEANQSEGSDTAPQPSSGYHATPKLENYTIEELERTLADLIDREEYEEADRVAKILEQKRNKS